MYQPILDNPMLMAREPRDRMGQPGPHTGRHASADPVMSLWGRDGTYKTNKTSKSQKQPKGNSRAPDSNSAFLTWPPSSTGGPFGGGGNRDQGAGGGDRPPPPGPIDEPSDPSDYGRSEEEDSSDSS